MPSSRGFHSPESKAILLGIVGMLVVAALVVSCGGSSGSSSMPMTGTGAVSVSISDPPSCKNPNGDFEHVYVTMRSVQAHTDPNATDNGSGWQELAPQLASAPMQVDLFSTAQTNCVQAQLGSASLPVGSYQQIRLLLVPIVPPRAMRFLPPTPVLATATIALY